MENIKEKYMEKNFNNIIKEIRKCNICEDKFGFKPHPVVIGLLKQVLQREHELQQGNLSAQCSSQELQLSTTPFPSVSAGRASSKPWPVWSGKAWSTKRGNS